ncbi:MAG TPA: nucleoside deaminase [Clostridiales bacterium]|nr:nucleoside deaminase [Clostridiales bacterium]
MYDTEIMLLALREAKKAAAEGEVPVGAVIAREGEVIATGRNRRENEKNALCHAEIEAINKACKKLGGWRLNGCDIYVTLEPCPMCAGAIINARLDRVIFGAYDEKAGSFGSLVNFNDLNYNHKPEIIGSVLENECKEVLVNFFSSLRNC